MDFVIRPYAPTDYDWVLQCEVELQEHERAMLIAENAEGQRVGLVAGHIVDEPWPMETRDSTRYGYVSDIFLKPGVRSSGLAKSLLDAIAAHLHRADPTLTRLRVNVLAVNRIACRAYEKAGFTPYEVMYERLLR